MTEFHFLQPLDVLYLRGNRLFADASTPGDAIMPPWPSMAAGALRSELLVTQGVDSGQFANGVKLPNQLAQCLGTPANPGTFRLSHFLLAKLEAGKLKEFYWPLPADVTVIADKNGNKAIYALKPQALHASIQTSAPCRQLPLFQTDKQAKAEGGLWLNTAGFQSWLNGEKLMPEHLVESKTLWKTDARLGIALDTAGRTTIESQLYTVDAIALDKHIGFLTGISGADGLMPDTGLLRLGGDGRGAEHLKIDWTPPQPDWDVITKTKRFRVALATPGLFEQGWLLPGISGHLDGFIWKTSEFSAHLVTASVSRADTISGWDLAENCPKPALKAVSTGSVYWFDRFEGNVQVLRKLVEQGLSSLSVYPDNKRHAEGFNTIFIAAWPH